MKTKTQIPALFLILSIMFATNTFAIKRDIKLEEETYIDDIPFDTEWVVYELMNPEFNLEDEAYIDDIPFNTACVAANCNYKKAVSVIFEMEEETYIDDMPFDTEKVAVNYAYNMATSVEYEMEDEANIDDIPFDTFSIAAISTNHNTINLYASEK